MTKPIPECLLEALQVVEGLRRSLQDIGRYTMLHGEEQGRKVLFAYAGPHLYRRLTHARDQLETTLLAVAPEREEELIALLDDDEQLQVWSGPTAPPPILAPDAELLVACLARHLDTAGLNLRDRVAVQEAINACANELESEAAAQQQNKPGSGQALLASWRAVICSWLKDGEHRTNLSTNLSAQTGYEWSFPTDRAEMLLWALGNLYARLPTDLSNSSR